MSDATPPHIDHPFTPPEGRPWGLCQYPIDLVEADGVVRHRCNLAEAAHLAAPAPTEEEKHGNEG